MNHATHIISPYRIDNGRRDAGKIDVVDLQDLRKALKATLKEIQLLEAKVVEYRKYIEDNEKFRLKLIAFLRQPISISKTTYSGWRNGNEYRVFEDVSLLLENQEKVWDYERAQESLKSIENNISLYNSRISDFQYQKLDYVALKANLEWILKKDRELKGGWEKNILRFKLGIVTLLAASTGQLIYPDFNNLKELEPDKPTNSEAFIIRKKV